MKLILFVCRGNTCRSPMAEAAARRAAASVGLGADHHFASAGTAPTSIGAPADPRALACAAAAGLDLAAHATRGLDLALLRSAHLLLPLDYAVRDQLRMIAPAETVARIVMLMAYAPALGRDEVADPWSGTAADYAEALRLIHAATDGLVASLRTE